MSSEDGRKSVEIAINITFTHGKISLMNKYRIVKTTIFENVVEKSRFIAVLVALQSENDYKDEILKIKKRWPKARHYPYAFVYDERSQSNDDGEPSGTCGRPLLSLLDNHQLNRVLIVVVRYFGGVKLGAGRLLRTYVDTANQAIIQAELLQEISGFHSEYELDFSQAQIIQNKISYYPDIQLKMDYTNKVRVQITSPVDVTELINEWLKGKILPLFIEKTLMLVPKSL